MTIAEGLDVDDRTPARDFLIFNIKRLAEEQRPVRRKLGEFQRAFLDEQHSNLAIER